MARRRRREPTVEELLAALELVPPGDLRPELEGYAYRFTLLLPLLSSTGRRVFAGHHCALLSQLFQQGACVNPVAFGGSEGNAQDLGRLLKGQAGEVTELLNGDQRLEQLAAFRVPPRGIGTPGFLNVRTQVGGERHRGTRRGCLWHQRPGQELTEIREPGTRAG